jgi:hypothetical protein
MDKQDDMQRDDFSAIEQQLRARADDAGAADQSAAEALRPRVLAAMRAASSQRKRAATPLWVFASGAAAAVVLLSNLALSAAQARPLVAVQTVSPRAVAVELRDLLPELDEREAFRHAVLLEARGRTADYRFQPMPGRTFSNTSEIEP